MSLRGKFVLNPLTGKGNPFYPDKCLDHSYAAWCPYNIDYRIAGCQPI